MAYKRETFAPQPLPAIESRTLRQGPFLTSTDPWFTALQEVRAGSAGLALQLLGLPSILVCAASSASLSISGRASFTLCQLQ